jgi:hypothetical protein
MAPPFKRNSDGRCPNLSPPIISPPPSVPHHGKKKKQQGNEMREGHSPKKNGTKNPSEEGSITLYKFDDENEPGRTQMGIYIYIYILSSNITLFHLLFFARKSNIYLWKKGARALVCVF